MGKSKRVRRSSCGNMTASPEYEKAEGEFKPYCHQCRTELFPRNQAEKYGTTASQRIQGKLPDPIKGIWGA